MNSSQSRASSPNAMPCANCRAISSMAIPAAATAVTTPPNTQNSTDEGDSGPSAMENIPATPKAQTSSMGQLRANLLLTVGSVLFLVAAIAFISMNVLIDENTAFAMAAMANITASQCCMAIVYMNQPKLASS